MIVRRNRKGKLANGAEQQARAIVKRSKGAPPALQQIVKRSKGASPTPDPVQARRQPSPPVDLAPTRGAIVRRHHRVVGAAGVQPRRRLALRRPHPHLRWPFRRRTTVGALTLVALAGIGYGGFQVWQSPVVQVNHIQVTGNERVQTTTIVERANLLGENIFTADLASAQRALYELPLVASVSIDRDWPNTLRITVEERRAWGTWEQAGLRYAIDREGVVLGQQAVSEGSPVIRSAERYSLVTGDRVNYQAVDAVAEIYERIPRQLGTTVSEVAFVPGKGVTVTTADGQVALLGDSSAISYKLAVWAAMEAEARRLQIDYTSIDLRYGNRPVVQ